jgi:hypothetical protein
MKDKVVALHQVGPHQGDGSRGPGLEVNHGEGGVGLAMADEGPRPGRRIGIHHHFLAQADAISIGQFVEPKGTGSPLTSIRNDALAITTFELIEKIDIVGHQKDGLIRKDVKMVINMFLADEMFLFDLIVFSYFVEAA